MTPVFLENIKDEHKNCAIALGNFDGVHIAHQDIIKNVINYAKENGVPASALIFAPHPSQLFGAPNFKLLLSLEDRVQKLLDLGLDHVIICKFDSDFSKIEAPDFIEEILMNRLKARFVASGYNFFFGHKRKGDYTLLSKYAKQGAFKYYKSNKVTFDYMDVSSSKIRDSLSTGRVSLAADMLGDNFSITGTVVEGKKIAKDKLGFPTANINLTTESILPLYGVYIVKSAINGTDYLGIANIGTRPTMNSETPTLETHFLDLKQDLYGQNLKIEFLEFVRPERKYESLEALKFHIEMDVKAARYIIRNCY